MDDQSKQPLIRPMTAADAPRVLDIYRMGIETGNATFETELPLWDQWDSRHLAHSRLVYDDGLVKGWVALSAVSSRYVYRGIAEVSIYVDNMFKAQGIGSFLMQAVIHSSEEAGIWTLFSSVFPENEATLRLHLHHGFRIIGRRERIAQLHEKWRDTVILERRSNKVGTV